MGTAGRSGRGVSRSRPRGYLYRPLTILSFRIDHLLGDGSPRPFHGSNLLLHAAVSALLLALSRLVAPAGARGGTQRLGRDQEAARDLERLALIVRRGAAFPARPN